MDYSCKFTCDRDKILIREFFFYNEDHLLIKEIRDDGDCAADANNLNKVTQRRIKRYEHDVSGLPSSVTEHYIHDGQEALLGKIEYSYNAQKLVSEERVFDGNDKLI